MRKVYALMIALFVVNGAMGQWFEQSSPTTNTLRSVYFTDVNTGYAVGDNGTVLKTTDGGENWISANIDTDFNLCSVHFPTADTGYITGGSVIFKTTDGGVTWVEKYSNAQGDLYSVYFLDGNTGYASGLCKAVLGLTWSPCIIKTTDGGTNWITITGEGAGGGSTFFLDVNTGYTAYNGQDNTHCSLWKTTDGGVTWSYLEFFCWLNSIYFLSFHTGYAVGISDNGDELLLKTTDGGSNWVPTVIEPYSPDTYTQLTSVYFTDVNTGYAVGGRPDEYGLPSEGCIHKTTDGGENWTAQYFDISFRSVHFPAADTGYAVGNRGENYSYNGIILKTTNGGGSPVGFNNHKQNANTLTIYPNPTSTDITIESSAPGQLSILNLNGQPLITRQVNEAKTVVDISTLPSGVYVVKVVGEKGVQVGKVVKQ